MASELTRRTRLETAAYVLDQVQALGLPLLKSCRLLEMHRALQRGQVPYDDPDFATVLESDRDMQTLAFVFDQLRASLNDPQFKKLVQVLLQDSALPQTDRENSHGRDSQFHLYLAAIAQNAGLMPTPAEPDLICTANGIEYGIAAKRLKSFQQFGKHVRKAAGQIADSGRPGIIALDLTLAWNTKNEPILSPLQNHFYETILYARTKKFFDVYHERIYGWVAGKGVLAVVVFDFVFRWLPAGTWQHDGSTNWLETTQGDSDAAQLFRVFYDQFMQGVPNCTEVAGAG